MTTEPTRSTLPQPIPSQASAPRLHLPSIRLSERSFAILLVLPAILGIFLVVLFPLLYSLWLSFTDVNLLRTTGPALELFGVRVPLFRWIGIQNYVTILDDPLYWSSLWRTVYFVLAFVVEAVIVGLGMALVLNERFAGRPLMRSCLLIPWSLSRVVVGLLWIGILDFEFGALNGVRVLKKDAQTLELECRDVKGMLLKVVGMLNELQIELISLETQEPNLERVFLHLTGRGLRD